MDTYLKVSVANNIGEVVLNRPKKLNIMDETFFKVFHEAVLKLVNDPDVRVILVHAEGPVFTAGLDLKSTAAVLNPPDGPTDPAEKNATLYKRIKDLQASLGILRSTNKPTVASIHGKCIGAGVDMITAADIRVCAKDATFAIAETKVAIVADLGTLQRITGIVGKGVAREMAFTGEPIDAQRALHCGLVNSVHDTKEQSLAAAREICAKIAANSPIVVSGTKKILNYSDEHTHEEGLEHVALWNSFALLSNDLSEAMMSFIQKRPPQFKSKL